MIIMIHQTGLMSHEMKKDDKEWSGSMTKNRIKVGRDRNNEWEPNRKDYKGTEESGTMTQH